MPVVYATFYPVAYFTKRIAGDLVRVECPLPTVADPAAWQPSREQVHEFQKAALIIANGAGFESWLGTASLPQSRLIDTSLSLKGEFIQIEAVTHSHGPAGEHSHAGIDPHIWVDPINAARQAEAIRMALIEKFPQHARTFDVNTTELLNDLQSLDTELKELSTRLNGVVLVASHPAFNYPARRYGWSVENLHFEPDQAIGDAELDRISHEVEHARRGPNTRLLMLWESEPSPATAAMILDRFAMPSVVFSPCECTPTRPDETYLTEMRANLDRVAAALDSMSMPASLHAQPTASN